MRALDRVNAYLVTPSQEMALETLAEPFDQVNRPETQRRDQAGGPRPAGRVEGDPQSRSCSLER